MMLNLKRIIILSVVAALYVVLTLISHPLAYGMIQFRISEVLVLLCFYRKDYGYALILGCFIANLFNPYNPILDAIVGTLATAITVFFISRSKNLFIASLYAVIFNAVIIGIELYFIIQTPLLLGMFYVALGQFVVVSIVGVMLFWILEKNKEFMKLIGANQNLKFVD